MPVLASLTDTISHFPYRFQFTRAARLKTVNRAFTSNHGSQLALIPANPNIDDCCFVVWVAELASSAAEHVDEREMTMRSPKALMSQNVCLNVTAILGASVLMLCGGTAALAQIPPAAPAQHAMTDPADQNKQLLDQIAELRSGLSERSHSRSSTRLAADASYSVRSFDAAIWGARVGPI